MNFSKYQLAVFDFAANSFGSACIESVAGSGKSTTAVAMIEKFSSLDQGLFSSFTRAIVDDLSAKIKTKGLSHIQAKTYNGFGAGIIYRYMKPAPKLLIEKTEMILKYDIKPNEHDFYKSKGAITRLVSLFKNLAVTEMVAADASFEDIVATYDIELPKVRDFKKLCLDTFNQCNERRDVIDYDDQKYFPILHGWALPQYDFLVLDEYQDSCPVESQLMLRSCNGGRVIVFGDSNQAIYSFKGTTPDSMKQFTALRNATRLALSICYRCSKAVVREAQKIVPGIEWADNAIEGEVSNTADTQNCTNADMILARTTEDLVLNVNRLLIEGRAAYIEGREYGTQLSYFIEKMNKEGNQDILFFKDSMFAHYNERHPELLKHGKENLALQLESRVQTIDALMIGCSTVSDLNRKINAIFTEKSNGVRHMTIHKSKGLESNGNVYILRPDKIPHPRSKNLAEEQRLKYVAITRAKRNLYYVQKGTRANPN